MPGYFTISLLHQIEKDNVRGVPDRNVVVGKIQTASCPIDFEHGDTIGPLITAIEEFSSRIETEAARIISPCPFFFDKSQFAALLIN